MELGDDFAILHQRKAVHPVLPRRTAVDACPRRFVLIPSTAPRSVVRMTGSRSASTVGSRSMWTRLEGCDQAAAPQSETLLACRTDAPGGHPDYATE